MRFKTSFFAAFTMCLGWMTPALAVDHAALVDKVSRTFIIPRYEALARSTAAQAEDWKAFCLAPKEDGIARLKDDFQAAADDWSSIEFIRLGPISQDNRHERIAHWPERKNAVGKAADSLLSRDDDASFTPERFAQTSVAGQGFSALERLLFDEGAEGALVGPESSRRCRLGLAITTSLATISHEVSRAWVTDPGLAGTPRETVTRLATDLLTIYQLVGDLKLSAVMGPSPDRARPALAEGRRAQRSTRSVVLNLKGAEALTSALIDTDHEGASVRGAIRTAISIAEELPPNFGPLAEEGKTVSRLLLLLNAVRGARDLSNDQVPVALGITLGFNSLDGD
jgi:predicted lipoprotein